MNTAQPNPENQNPGDADNEFRDLPGEDAELMNAIRQAVQTIQPDARFAGELEAELQGAIQPAPQSHLKIKTSRLPPWAATGMKTTAWIALAVILMVGLGWAIQNLRTGTPQPGSALEGGGQLTTQTSSAESTSPTASAVPDSSPTPEQTDEAVVTTNLNLTYTSLYFPEDLLIVQAAAPAVKPQYGVYTIAAPVAPNLDSVRALAAKLGIENAGIFRTAPENAPNSLLAASNGKQRLTFYYTHGASFDYIADYQHFGAQSLDLPPAEAQASAAEDFLTMHGLLDFPYTVSVLENWPGRVQFTRLVEEIPLQAEHSIVVNIDDAGAVRQVTYNPPILEKIGEYPIISAAEAWQVVLDGQAELGLEISSHSEVPNTLQTWMRTYEPGEQVDIFGILEVLLPADGSPAQVFLNNYLLTGNTDSLVQMAGGETFVEVWGSTALSGDFTVIEVTGWQTTLLYPEIMQGPVTWVGETAFVEYEDQLYRLPGLPANAPGRQPATVYGVRILQPSDGGSAMVDWITLSSGEAGGGGGGSGPAFAALDLSASTAANPGPQEWPASQEVDTAGLSGGRIISVTGIELVYWVPEPIYSPWAEEPAAGMNYVQPVWRFSGLSDDGSAFEILVQALAGGYLVK